MKLYKKSTKTSMQSRKDCKIVSLKFLAYTYRVLMFLFIYIYF